MVDMGTAIWRGVADFASLLSGQKKAGQGFDEMGGKSDKAGQKSESFGKKVATSMSGIGDKAKKAGTGLSVGLTLPIVALGTKAVQSFANFEQSITAAGAKTEASGAQMEQMKNIALDMGAKTKFSAGEAAEAMDNMAAAGFTANGVMEALPGVMLAAQAAGEGLGLTADVTAKAINAFGLEAKDASHVADVFATAANTSALDMQGLGESLAHAGQLGAGANQDLEDVVATLGRLVDMGVPAASAGVGVRQAIQSLQAPTAKARGYMADLNLEFRNADGTMKKLPDILDELKNGFDQNNPLMKAAAKEAGLTGIAYRDMAFKAMFGVEGGKAMTLALSEGKPVMLDAQKDAEKLGRLQEGLAKTMGGPAAAAWIKARTEQGKFTASGADAVRALGALGRASDGTSKKIGDIMADTTAARLDQLGGAFETLAIRLITAVAPALTDIIKSITSAVNWFAEFAKDHPGIAKIAIVLGVILAVIGPLLIGLGMMATAIGAIAALGAPVILTILAIVAAIAILIAAGILIYKNWDKIKAFFIMIWSSIVSFAKTVWGGLVAFFSAIWSAISGAAKAVWGAIVAYFQAVWSQLVAVFTAVWNAIRTAAVAVWTAIVAAVTFYINVVKTVITTVLAGLQAAWSAFWGVFGGLLTAVWEFIVALVRLQMRLLVGTIMASVNTIVSGVVALWNVLKNASIAVWNALVGAAKAVWGAIWGVLSPILSALKTAVLAVWTALKSASVAAWNGIKSAAGAVWAAIKKVIVDPIVQLWGAMKGPINTVKTSLSSAWSSVKTAATNAWNGLKTSISNAVSSIGTTVSGVKDKVVGAMRGAGSWLLDAGKKVIGGFIDGLKSQIGQVTGVLNGITDKIPDWKGPARRDSKLLVENGKLVMRGFQTGLWKGATKVMRSLKSWTGQIEARRRPSGRLMPEESVNTQWQEMMNRREGWRLQQLNELKAMAARRMIVNRATAAQPVTGQRDSAAAGTTVQVTVNNPVGESTAESVSRAVTRLAQLGVTR